LFLGSTAQGYGLRKGIAYQRPAIKALFYQGRTPTASARQDGASSHNNECGNPLATRQAQNHHGTPTYPHIEMIKQYRIMALTMIT